MLGKNQSLKFIIPVVTLVVIGAVAYGGVWYWQTSNKPSVSDNAVVEEPVVVNPEEDTALTPNATVKWNGDGIPMADLKLIVKYQDDYSSALPGETPQGIIKYYDLGTNDSKKIILAVAPAIDPGGPAIFFFEQTPQGDRLMTKMSSASIYSPESKQGYVLAANLVEPDTTTFYNGIVGPANIIYSGLTFKQTYLNISDLFKNYVSDQKLFSSVTITKVSTVDAGDLYVRQQKSSSSNNVTADFYIRKYLLKLPSGLYTLYNSKYAFFTDNSVPLITWNDGTQNEVAYSGDASLGGCGNPGAFVAPMRDVSGAVQVSGTTNNGEKVYEFKDINDPIMKYFYEIGGKAYSETTSQYEKIAFDQWATYHPVILYKNALGDYVIFTNDKYGSGAECGKPVIYLYPTKQTNVKVQVGAEIIKSEPAYNNGWQVQANSSGELKTVNGNTYESLFWEGLGNGFYPAITEGVIVPRNQVASTLKLQLKELGLSGKESKDFLEFWLSKMPQTPYTRLTWFTTKQMNELAPLFVWPKPDTTIRVFLDFQGLQNPISLPAQHLAAVPRNGFTLIEWGGLLRK